MPAFAPVMENAYLSLMDAFFARWPAGRPSDGQLRQCRLIAHRGDHNHHGIKENTLAAFDQSAAAGVWGLEMDLRWTRDRVPVIIHDPNLARLFQNGSFIHGITLKQLRRMAPAVPTLEEVVIRFGRRCHLLIEVKQTPWPDPTVQNQILGELLGPFNPVTDYHLLALDPAALVPIKLVPREAMVLIAYHWPAGMFRRVEAEAWGGLCGHYTMISDTMVRRLQTRRKVAGTGYVASTNCLFREIGRGVDWIISNNAKVLQHMLHRLVGNTPPNGESNHLPLTSPRKMQ